MELLSEEKLRRSLFFRPARIRSSYLVMDAASADPMKMLCGICQKPLRRKPFFIGITLSSTEVSVVAALVCSHVYHADCFEKKTTFEDRRDPACPLLGCSSSKIQEGRFSKVGI